MPLPPPRHCCQGRPSRSSRRPRLTACTWPRAGAAARPVTGRSERIYYTLLQGWKYLTIPRKNATRGAKRVCDGREKRLLAAWVVRRGSRVRAFGGCGPRRGRCAFGGNSTIADGKDESSGLAPDKNNYRVSNRRSAMRYARAAGTRGLGESRPAGMAGGTRSGAVRPGTGAAEPTERIRAAEARAGRALPRRLETAGRFGLWPRWPAGRRRPSAHAHHQVKLRCRLSGKTVCAPSRK